MKKLILALSLAAMFLSSEAYADVITPEEALARMSASKHVRAPEQGAAKIKLVKTIENAGVPTVYVFSGAESGTYVLSADDMTAPVLGYTDAVVPVGVEMPPQLEGLLAQYSGEIENIRKSGRREAVAAPAETKAPIEPMCTALWGQSDPYNNKCPEVNGLKALVGCGAVAMAQVMNYFEWPVKGTGTGTAYDPADSTYTMPLDVEFDWANMADTYRGDGVTEAQTEAVSTLMAACGYAAGMVYSPNWSESTIVNITKALKENFSYSKSLKFDRKLYYDMNTWSDMVYASLADGSPVIYRGYSASDGGHIFVCDGYADGYFHINWGWYGSFNGYFLLSALNPYSIHTGVHDGGFSEGQWAIFNIKKDDGAPAKPEFAAGIDRPVRGWIDTDVTDKRVLRLSSFFCNVASNPIDVAFVVAATPVGGNIGTDGRLLSTGGSQRGLQPDYGWSSISCSWHDGDFAPGRYIFTVMAAPYDYKAITDMVPLRKSASHPDCVMVEIADDYTPKIYYYNSNIIKVTGVSGADNLRVYQNEFGELEVTFHNPSKVRVGAFISPVLMVDNSTYRSEAVFVELEPDESLTRKIHVRFFYRDEVAEQKVSLRFADYDSYTYVSDAYEVTLLRSSEEPSLSTNGFRITDDGVNTLGFTADILCNAGYYANTLRLGIYFDEPENNYPLAFSHYTDIYCLEKDDTKPFAVVVNYPTNLIGRKCRATISYNDNGKAAKIAEAAFTIGVSGVDAVAADMRKIVGTVGAVTVCGYEGCSINVYGIDGRRVAGVISASAEERISLAPGIYIVCADGASTKVVVR